MAVNPDDLLIFKAREGEGQEAEEAKKTEKKRKEKPVPEKKQKGAAEQRPPQLETPLAQWLKPKPKPAPKPEDGMTLDQKIAQRETVQKETARAVEQVTAPVQAPQPQAQMPSAQNAEVLLNTELEQKLGYEEAPPQIPSMRSTGVPERRVSVKEMKNIASHLSCELHPWRKAYAICDYCKRAFCYEDIVEHGNAYYCLDDIDKVSAEVRTEEVTKYGALGFVASGLFMLVFLIFVISSYQSLTGLPGELPALATAMSITNPTVILLMGTALAALSLISGVLVIVQAKGSFPLGAVIGVLTAGVFAYRYLAVHDIFSVAIAAVAVVAVLTLGNSRVAYESLPEATVEKVSAGGAMGVSKSSY